MCAEQKLYAGLVSSVVLSLLVLCLPSAAVARPIHYGAIEHVGLQQCDALEWAGNIQSARQCYQELLQQTHDPALQAEISWVLGDIKSANSLFQSATRLMPDNPRARLRWGDLFMQTYQYRDAMDLFVEALQLEPSNAYARVGAARALAERFESEAMEYLLPVLEDTTAPAGARLQARLLLARMAMESSDMDRAFEILAEADAIANNAQLPKLEIYALYATADLLKGNNNRAWIDKALGENPVYGDIYAIPGYFFWINRRYRESVELFRQAVAIQPENWIAHMELGINLLRNNEVSEARRHLEIAYSGDPYNPKTVNTLRLLDTFVDYDLINSPRQPPADGFPHVIFRLHKNESAVLLPYAERLAEQGLKEFARRYQFEPREPVIAEIYPNHDDFVVRTIGMPGVGILGAAFGYVFAMDSPSDHPDNEYHWGTTFWHELAHVFTLEATRHMIPRWFSEGISVFEEWRYGPIKGIRIPVNVYEFMAQGKFLPIAELDQGFLRPTYNEQVIVSYMQAGLVCEYIDLHFGADKIADLLAVFKQGVDTGTAIEQVLGISPETFDKGFNTYLNNEFGDLVANLDQWKKFHQTGINMSLASDWPAAIDAASKAITLFPEYVESDSPYIVLARAYANTEDKEKELQTLMAFWQRGGFAPEALRLLAHNLYDTGRAEEAIAVLDSINYVDPFNVELHTTLGDWLLEAGKPDEALTEYEVVLAMNPHDRAAAHYRVARANHQLNHKDESRRHLLSALEIAPHYRPAQMLLLELTQTTQQ